MKCAICLATKGKRSCDIHSGHAVCPQCCASIRTEKCAECVHYRQSQAYAKSENANPIRNRNFTIEILPEVDEICDKAVESAQAGKVDAAEKILKKVLDEHPDYHNALFGMGLCCGHMDRIDEAASYFKRVVEVFPPFIEAHFNLGVCHIKNANIGKAVEAFRNVIALDGECGEYGSQARKQLDDFDRITRKGHGLGLRDFLKSQSFFDRGFDALMRKDFQQAIDLFNQVLRIEKNHVQSYGNLGLAYAGLGDKERALSYFDKALALDPSYEPARKNRLALEQTPDGKTLIESSEMHEINYYRERVFSEKKNGKISPA